MKRNETKNESMCGARVDVISKKVDGILYSLFTRWNGFSSQRRLHQNKITFEFLRSTAGVCTCVCTYARVYALVSLVRDTSDTKRSPRRRIANFSLLLPSQSMLADGDAAATVSVCFIGDTRLYRFPASYVDGRDMKRKTKSLTLFSHCLVSELLFSPVSSASTSITNNSNYLPYWNAIAFSRHLFDGNVRWLVFMAVRSQNSTEMATDQRVEWLRLTTQITILLKITIVFSVSILLLKREIVDGT